MHRVGRAILRVLDGEHRVTHGWGFFPVGVGTFLWAYAYSPKATAAVRFPPEPGWRSPVMAVGVAMAVVGLFLLLAPLGRKLVISVAGRYQTPIQLRSFRKGTVKQAAPAPSSAVAPFQDPTVMAAGRIVLGEIAVWRDYLAFN